MSYKAAPFLLLPLIGLACNRVADSLEPIPCPAIVMVRVVPAAVTMQLGSEAQLRAVYGYYASTGRECQLVELDGPFNWSSRDTNVARVDSIGRVNARGSGATLIVAAWRANPRFAAAVTLTVSPRNGGT